VLPLPQTVVFTVRNALCLWLTQDLIAISPILSLEVAILYFKISATYHTEKDKRRLKRSKSRAKLFTLNDFHFDEENMNCRCPAGKLLWLSSSEINTGGKVYSRFTGYLKDCQH
jgi:hypothetical protein